MAFPQGINFRSTLGYVTDGVNDSFEGSTAVSYPRTTAQGNTVGWEVVNSGISVRDRKNTNDARLAGDHFNGSTDVDTFRIDLPSAGSYNVRVAAGDGLYSNNTKVELFDTTTSLGVLCSGTTGAANSFKDATNATLTAANWVSSNTAASKTFSSTVARFKIGNGSTACVVAHVYIESAGGATDTPVSPGAGSIALTGFAPIIAQTANQVMAPAASLILINGFAPTIAQTNVTDTAVSPAASVILLTGFAPTITQANTSPVITPDAGALTITGYAPTITQSGTTSSGGYLDAMPRRRSVREERERLGIIPKRVKRLIEAVAEESVAEEKTDLQALAALASTFEQHDIGSKPQYAAAMRAERDRLQARSVQIQMAIRQREQKEQKEQQEQAERQRLADEEDEREVYMLLM